MIHQQFIVIKRIFFKNRFHMTNIDFNFNYVLNKIRYNSWKCFFLTKLYKLQTTTPTYISFRSQSFLTSPYCRLMNVQNTNLQKLVTKQVSPNSTTWSFDTCVHSFIHSVQCYKHDRINRVGFLMVNLYKFIFV